MTKIKIVGIIILALSLALAMVSGYISNHNKVNNSLLETINQQKAFTQEISKNIFYIYKNKNGSITQLDKSIKSFLNNMDKRDNTLDEVPSEEIKKQSKKIVLLWNKFYLDVQKFRNQNKISSPYINIIVERTVRDIYATNLKLIYEFDKLIFIHQGYFHDIVHNYRLLQYFLFFILVLSLVYLIIYISKATSNLDFLIKKIDKSIVSIDQIENNVEEFLETIDTTNNDIELTKKEDAVIESLEELMNSSIRLKQLKIDLDNLIKLKD